MLFLVTVVLAWGLTWPVNKVILNSLAPLWAVAIRTVEPFRTEHVALMLGFVLALVGFRAGRPQQ